MKKILTAITVLIVISGLTAAFGTQKGLDMDWDMDDSDWDSDWDLEFEEIEFDDEKELDLKDKHSDKDKKDKDKKDKDKKDKDKKDKDKKDKDKKPEKVYWQVDFSQGEVPMPPSYYPRDLMAGLGNTEDGPTQNPSVLRQENQGELGDVTIEQKKFQFDNQDNPTQATVSFTVDEDAETRDLHLASFKLPGEFDIDELDQQELFDSKVKSFEGGESGNLTVSIPTQ